MLRGLVEKAEKKIVSMRGMSEGVAGRRDIDSIFSSTRWMFSKYFGSGSLTIFCRKRLSAWLSHTEWARDALKILENWFREVK